jgi:acyl-lipid omega-6 desaturase (Delta-12 desaturase)
MPTVARLKHQKRAIIAAYTDPVDARGYFQVLATLVPLGALWAAAVTGMRHSLWISALATVAISLFVLRAFVLMHECGHGSLFRTARLNRAFGFVLGVITGMPQYVWSRHHQYHHATNGDWEKFRGVLGTCTVDEYAGWTEPRRRSYRRARNIWAAPFAGFMYLIFYPRLTWLSGSARLLGHLAFEKVRAPARPLTAIMATFETTCWDSPRAFRHMSWNNLVVLGLYVLCAWWLGPAVFFPVYAVSVALAGAAGIVLFSVQHNFEHSYASRTVDWDYDAAVLRGTSFLVLPAWLNWMTANIGYHHVHHMSARIPSYRLAQCHRDHSALFAEVPRLGLADIPGSLRCILWDADARRIISVAEWERRTGTTATGV